MKVAVWVCERERKIVVKKKKGVNCISSSWSYLYRHLFIRAIWLWLHHSQTFRHHLICVIIYSKLTEQSVWRKAAEWADGNNHRGIYSTFFFFFFFLWSLGLQKYSWGPAIDMHNVLKGAKRTENTKNFKKNKKKRNCCSWTLKLLWRVKINRLTGWENALNTPLNTEKQFWILERWQHNRWFWKSPLLSPFISLSSACLH